MISRRVMQSAAQGNRNLQSQSYLCNLINSLLKKSSPTHNTKKATSRESPRSYW